MKWSRYNLLFTSERFGHFLYNALSNTLAEISEETRGALLRVQHDPAGFDFTQDPALYAKLRLAKVLVDDQEEERLLSVIRTKWLARNYDATGLGLTIAPTLACNFDCTYCYQQQHRAEHMDARTEDRVIRFIQRFGKIQRLHVSWYGGEPLLRFDTMCRLTERIKALGTPFSASMITNAYLLEPDVIGRLEQLEMKSIQVTIDGPEEIHDRRRVHASGAPTYARILGNLERLMEAWRGLLQIRINVDQSNLASYADTYRRLGEQFAGKKVQVYPGIVGDSRPDNPDLHCELDRQQTAAFSIDAYREHGILPRDPYPRLIYGCAATNRNAFIVGPLGEVYKCWRDLGNRDMVVGSIFDEREWDVLRIADYMTGTSSFDQPECRECFFLPVCSGGCANHRLRRQLFGEDCDHCVTFKDRLPEYLEICYEKSVETKTGEGEDARSSHRADALTLSTEAVRKNKS